VVIDVVLVARIRACQEGGSLGFFCKENKSNIAISKFMVSIGGEARVKQVGAYPCNHVRRIPYISGIASGYTRDAVT
jgi:hypothetical protein